MDQEHAPAKGPERSQRSRASHREMADALRTRISSGALRPGQRLPTQVKPADEFGVERGAVREALRILQSEHRLADVSKGSPAAVAVPPGPARLPAGPSAAPQPTMVGLAPRVAAAFAAPHVEHEHRQLYDAGGIRSMLFPFDQGA